jgi:predicted metal-dependent HD superfamily phosphohydrolase
MRITDSGCTLNTYADGHVFQQYVDDRTMQVAWVSKPAFTTGR